MCIVLQIVSESNCTLIIAVNDVLIADVVADFVEEAVQPDEFLEGMKESPVFRFSAEERD